MSGFKFMDGSGFNDQGQPFGAGGAPYRLPQIAPSGQASYAGNLQPGQPNSADPITNFNLRLMEMLQQAQKAPSNAPLYAQSEQLQNAQVSNAMAPAAQLGIDNLRPGDALNARQRQDDLYEPVINSINDRIKLNNETVKNFESALKAAKEYGEEYAKTVKPDDNTIQAVKDQMAAGFLPSATVIEKLGKFLTVDDWNALANAKKTDDKNSQNTETIGGSKYRISYDANGNVVNKVYIGPSDDGVPSDTEKKADKQTSIISRAKSLPRGSNNFANPMDYLDAASDYVAAGGSVNDFIAAVIPSRQLSPSDAEYVRQELNRAQPSSSTPSNPFKK